MNVATTDVIFFGQPSMRPNRRIVCPEASHIYVSELAVWVFLAIFVILASPALLHHIMNIICWRSKEQMGRIAAFPVVAFMKNPETIRYWPEGKLIGEPMRPHAASSKEVDAPISDLHKAARPWPAPINSAAIDASPELGNSLCEKFWRANTFWSSSFRHLPKPLVRIVNPYTRKIPDRQGFA